MEVTYTQESPMNIEEAIKSEIRKGLKEELEDIATDLMRIRNLFMQFKKENSIGDISGVVMPSSENKKLYFTEKEAVIRYGLSKQWLAQMRYRGGGPNFLKVGKKVLYPIQETDDWFKNFTKSNTVITD